MKCSYCGSEIMPGIGIVYVKKDGTASNFCSRKCRKNQELGRDKKKFKWTTYFKKAQKT